ncbi:MAG: NRDE family protein, partial [Oligoflexia bacterium]|nr:NRDE family protein [Oligoflexia bacterium]
AAFWPEKPWILGGRDLEHGGTWQGLTRDGRFAVLTNFRDLSSLRTGTPSRGRLVSDFLEGRDSPELYARLLEKRLGEYNSYNLLFGRIAREPERSELWYLGSREGAARRLPPGIYGLSNHLLDTPWPKLSRAKAAFHGVLSEAVPELEKAELVRKMFKFLAWPEQALDHELPNTGVPLELERALSSLFIVTPGYGTRCSTVVLLDRVGEATFVERPFAEEGARGRDVAFEFRSEFQP